jgi:hypothetical protein
VGVNLIGRTPPGTHLPETMDEEESYQHVFYYFRQSLKILAMEPEPQCGAQRNFNVAGELKDQILSGRYLIGVPSRLGFECTPGRDNLMISLVSQCALRVHPKCSRAGAVTY